MTLLNSSYTLVNFLIDFRSSSNITLVTFNPLFFKFAKRPLQYICVYTCIYVRTYITMTDRSILEKKKRKKKEIFQ